MNDKGATKVEAAHWGGWRPEAEIFRFGFSTWDVNRAKKILLAKRKLELHSISVQALKPLSGLMGIDWNRVKKDIALPPEEQTIDLRVPLIIVVTKDGALPIDGWHRIGKAIQTNTPELPAVILSKIDEKRVRISGPTY